ncbi:murein transglycosylase [Bacteroidia bacterium]|nr:murein transglycosylase [Bacteroidia bacterium]
MKNKFILFFLTAGIILSAFVLISSKDNALEDYLTQAFTVSVPIPDEVNFCGEKISLKRLDMRERFDREINSFTYLHSTTLLYIKRANRFFPIIEPILKKNGIPDDFKYLCVIESGLDTRALSSAKAAGLWQFMEGTAKNYGLEIRDGVDERYHVEKATEAACTYLRDAYSRYGDWASVAASYNAGMGRISSEMQKQYVSSAFDLWLVQETSRYVFRILAAKEIFTHPRKYGFLLQKEDLYPPVAVNYVEISTDIPDLPAFAIEQGINYMQLKEFNTWLRDSKLTIPKTGGKTYHIAIPRDEDLVFDKNHIRVHNKAWLAK